MAGCWFKNARGGKEHSKLDSSCDPTPAAPIVNVTHGTLVSPNGALPPPPPQSLKPQVRRTGVPPPPAKGGFDAATSSSSVPSRQPRSASPSSGQRIPLRNWTVHPAPLRSPPQRGPPPPQGPPPVVVVEALTPPSSSSRGRAQVRRLGEKENAVPLAARPMQKNTKAAVLGLAAVSGLGGGHRSPTASPPSTPREASLEHSSQVQRLRVASPRGTLPLSQEPAGALVAPWAVQSVTAAPPPPPPAAQRDVQDVQLASSSWGPVQAWNKPVQSDSSMWGPLEPWSGTLQVALAPQASMLQVALQSDPECVIMQCTGMCGRTWDRWEDVPYWSKNRPRKPWCNQCGNDVPGPWNDYKPCWA